MPPHPNDPDHPFRQSRPNFIDLLSDDRPRALKEFAELADPWLRVFSPRELRQIDPSHHDEMRQVILVSFLDRDGRKLTLYKDNGSEFRNWFGTVCRNACLDWIDANARRAHPPIDPDEPAPAAPRPLPRAIKKLVRDCFRQLDVTCRLALLLELKVGKTVTRTTFGNLLGMEQNESLNSDASNSLRYCRKKMRKLLIDEAKRRGIDPTELGAP